MYAWEVRAGVNITALSPALKMVSWALNKYSLHEEYDNNIAIQYTSTDDHNHEVQIEKGPSSTQRRICKNRKEQTTLAANQNHLQKTAWEQLSEAVRTYSGLLS